MKIGFIQAQNEMDVNWFKPLAFGYLKAYLERYCDMPVDMGYLEKLGNIEHLDILAISSTSQDFWIAEQIARKAKQQNKNIITVLGGHHITYLPQSLPEEIDIGVLGEGEQTFLEIVRLVHQFPCRTWINKLSSIHGIVFHHNGQKTITPARDLIEPLDRIPFPYRAASEKFYFFSSRGCPYKCAFCSSSAFWNKTRFFSAEYVVNEMESLLQNNPRLKHISIWDDLFIANLPRLKKIVSLLEERSINKKCSFDLSVRANLVTPELCDLLRRMNVVSIGFGAESGSDRILSLLHKNVTVQTNQQAIDTLFEYNIQIGCSLIVGCPTETEAEVRSTYEFILKNMRADKVSPLCAVNILMPMPGTPIWDNAVASGLIDIHNLNWKRLSVFASYRNSNIGDFDQWVQLRRQNDSVYLAENTLPQERLYEIMSYYEKIIKELGMMEKPVHTNQSETTGMRFLKKCVKAMRILIKNPKEFKIKAKRHIDIIRYRLTPGRLIGSKQTDSVSPFPFPESKLAHQYCRGKGLEIGGSAHNPFGLNTLNVDFTDSMDTVFKKDEVKLCGRALPVDIVAGGDDIPLPDASQDFVISSHVIEHFPNPIKALKEWDRLIRPGGIIFMIVPHKERTFDKDKECTSIDHIIQDFENNNTSPHKDPHGHDHCWTTETFVEMINYVKKYCSLNWDIVEIQDVDDKVGNGFTLVIRKTLSKEN